MVLSACPNSGTKDEKNKTNEGTSQSKPQNTNDLISLRTSTMNASFEEIIDVAVDNTNQFILIESECGHYQNAYGALP